MHLAILDNLNFGGKCCLELTQWRQALDISTPVVGGWHNNNRLEDVSCPSLLCQPPAMSVALTGCWHSNNGPAPPIAPMRPE
jgi:hypothetical protein